MPFLVPFIPLIAGGLGLGAAALSRKKSNSGGSSSSAPIPSELSPLIDLQKSIGTKASESGFQDTASARGSLNIAEDFFKKILSGSNEDLMSLLNVEDATRNIDENTQVASELMGRGGVRSAVLGNAGFERDAALNNLLKSLRFSAPTNLANIGQAFANLGLGELSTAQGAGAQASNIIFGQQQLQSQAADRRAALIGSIFETAGGVAGAIIASRSS